MKYNGIELEPITTPQIFDPPKEMLVWDRGYKEPTTENVYAITKRKIFPVITDISGYDYCAEIPQQKSKRATYIQFSEWLAKGNGVYLYGTSVRMNVIFPLESRNEVLEEDYKIQPFGTTKWIEPTLENMGMEEK